MKKREERMFEELVKFCNDHDNPSIFAIQELLNVDYFMAAKMRSRLINLGLATLIEEEKKTNNTQTAYKIVIGNIVVTKMPQLSI